MTAPTLQAPAPGAARRPAQDRYRRHVESCDFVPLNLYCTDCRRLDVEAEDESWGIGWRVIRRTSSTSSRGIAALVVVCAESDSA